MNTWSIKRNGKIERIIIFYVGLFAFLFIIYIITTRVSYSKYSYIDFLISFSIFWMPIALIGIFRIIKSKIAMKISILKDKLVIQFKKNDIIEIPIANLAYAITDKHKSHISLTIYKKFEGSRGQDVFKKVNELIGRDLTLAWKKKQLLELYKLLESLHVTRTDSDNRDLPLWERILSN